MGRRLFWHRWSERRRRGFRRLAIVVALAAVSIGGFLGGRAWWRAAQADHARRAGLAAHAAGDWPTAVHQLGIAVRRGGEDAELLFAYGDALACVPRADNMESAIAARTLRAALHAGSPRRRTLERLLEIDLGRGMLPEAESAARALLADDADHRGALRALVAVLAARGTRTELDALLAKRVAKDPGDLGLRVLWIDTMAQGGAATEELLARLDAWKSERDAPAGLEDVRLAVEIARGVPDEVAARVARLDAQPAPRSEAHALVRARVLRALGRSAEAFATLEGAAALDAEGTLAREALRMHVFDGDREGAASALAAMRQDSAESKRRHAVLASACAATLGTREELVGHLAAIPPGEPASAAWRAAIERVTATDPSAAGVTPAMLSLDPLALAVLEERCAAILLAQGSPADAARHASRAVEFSSGSWSAARAREVEALAESGDFDRALARAAQARGAFAAASLAERCEWAARTLRIESRQAAESGRFARAAESRRAEALSVLREPSASPRAVSDAGVALAFMGECAAACEAARELVGRLAKAAAAQDPAEARASEAMASEAKASEVKATKPAADTALEYALRLAALVELVGRACDEPSIVLEARSAIASSPAAAVPGCRWQIARLDALAAERRGEFAQARRTLRDAALDEQEPHPAMRRARLAETAAFADRHGLEGVSAEFMQSFPEGAPLAAMSRTALVDAALCRAALTALGVALKSASQGSTVEAAELDAAREPHPAPRPASAAEPAHQVPIAIASLRLTRLDAGAMPTAEALECADRALKGAGRHVQLLAEMGETLLVAEPSNPALAAEYLRRAYRLAPRRFDIARRAMQALLEAQDRPGVLVLAEELPTGSSATRESERLRVAALVEGGEPKRAAEVAQRLASATHLDADHALAARALFLSGDRRAAEAEASRGLSAGPSPECASVLAQLPRER